MLYNTKSYNKFAEVKDSLLFFHVLHSETGFNKCESEKNIMSKLYGGLAAIRSGTMSFEEVLVYYGEMPLPMFIYSVGIIKKKEGNTMSKIRNQAYIDLRNFTPEALKKIESITNVTLVMLPENPTSEFVEAYADIKKLNVVSETNVPGNACVFNGMSELTKNDLSPNSLAVCNGMTIVRDVPKEMNVRIIVNGMMIKSPSAFVEPLKINGATYTIDDDAKIIKSLPEINIDRNFMGNLSDKTAIIACGRINIENDVTEAMLQSKGVVFYDIHKIIAEKELHGYIQANSKQVAKVCTPDEPEAKKRKKKFSWWK